MNLWIARDKNGLLYLYKHEPKLISADKSFCDTKEDIGFIVELNEDIYPEVTFENSPLELHV